MVLHNVWFQGLWRVGVHEYKLWNLDTLIKERTTLKSFLLWLKINSNMNVKSVERNQLKTYPLNSIYILNLSIPDHLSYKKRMNLMIGNDNNNDI